MLFVRIAFAVGSSELEAHTRGEIAIRLARGSRFVSLVVGCFVVAVPACWSRVAFPKAVVDVVIMLPRDEQQGFPEYRLMVDPFQLCILGYWFRVLLYCLLAALFRLHMMIPCLSRWFLLCFAFVFFRQRFMLALSSLTIELGSMPSPM